jgi:uncharacterized protein DUF1524/excalibur calcium-binding domain-containing protein
MRVTTWAVRVLVGGTTAVLAITGLTGATGTAAASTGSTTSSRFLLGHLSSATEHPAGYERDLFSLWSDADGDGCDARAEVLIAEATTRPRVGAGCALSGGRWRSKYDGVTTSNPSSFDIDHMVPLNEAWQSGAWRWSAATRKAYANDLGYKADLIAVSAHSNRSKGDQEPQDWMAERASYGCIYVKQWVAIKWRWHLSVNASERTFLDRKLSSCGWPRVPTPSRPGITTGTASSGGGGSGGGGNSGGGNSGGGSGSGGLDPRFDFCYNAIAAGYGPYYRGTDPEYAWYTDSDGDGAVCES